MKRILIAVICLLSASARAQTPTATATSTATASATETPTPTATATATGTPTATATATATAAPMGSPVSSTFRWDTQNQKKALEVKQDNENRVTVTNDGPAAKVSGPQDVAIGSDPVFFSVTTNFVNMSVSQLDVGCISLLFPFTPALSCTEYANGGWQRIVKGAGASEFVEEDLSLVTANRNQKRPDKDGTIAMLSDTGNVIGEAHFEPANVGGASISGNVASVSYNSPGSYQVNFATTLSDANYGTMVSVGEVDGNVWVGRTVRNSSNDSALTVRTSTFIVGIGIVIADADPNQVTVVIYKNP